jgi:(2R)-ethylmalonyl-CoA mutase
MGGAVAAVEAGYMKEALVESNARRLAARSRPASDDGGRRQQAFTESTPSPLVSARKARILVVDDSVEARAGRQPERLAQHAR